MGRDRGRQQRPGYAQRHVSLVADIPHKLVFGRLEHRVQRDGQLNHSEVGTKMPAVFGQHRDHFIPDLLGKLLKLLHRTLPLKLPPRPPTLKSISTEVVVPW